MRINRFVLVLSAVCVGTGCASVTSQVVEKPRVDQEMKGNRGYLAGSAPQAQTRKSTRQIIQTDIELATGQEVKAWWKRKTTPSAQPQAQAQPAGPAKPVQALTAPVPAPSDWEEEPSAPPAPVRPKPAEVRSPSTYVVQKGDTLEKIAKKLYGDPNQWRQIYNANKDKLASPNRIYSGQKLVIPPSEKETSRRRGGEGDLK